MLKFADLNVDFNSLENSLNSYMKLFPGSYTPLLIMYLAHEGLLKLVIDFDYSDPRVIVGVEPSALKDFFGESFFKDIQQDEITFGKNESIKSVITRVFESMVRGRDYDVMLPLITLDQYLFANEPVALFADIPQDSAIVNIIKAIHASDKAIDNPAALLYYSVVLMEKYNKSNLTAVDGNLLSDNEVDETSEMNLWIEDFENMLNKIQSYSFKKEWSQPKELTNVVLSQYHGGSIYNPFAGLASYNVQGFVGMDYFTKYDSSFNIGNYYYGEEISELTWAIGKLRLLAYHADSENYILGDSSNWRKGTANNVFSTPPFGLRITNEKGKEEYADSFVIRRGMDMLAVNGLLACVVPLSFFHRKDSKQLRKKIVDSGWLESIVYLPEKLFTYTDIRTAIIFIRKSKHNNVALINATKAVMKSNSRQSILDHEKVANLLAHDTYPSSFKYDFGCRMEEDLTISDFEKMKMNVDIDKISAFDYELMPGNFFLEKVPVADGCKLIEMRDIISGMPSTARSEGLGKVIRPSMLSRDEFTFITPDSITEDKVKKEYKVINRDALLYSPLSSLRPTLLLNSTGEKLYYKPDTIHAVYLKKNVVVPEYIVLELNKPYVQEQVSLLTKGFIPKLYQKEFEALRINIPLSLNSALSLERETYDKQKDQYYNRINAELVRLKENQHNEYVLMLRQRKHRIQQVMNELGPALALLDDCRIENGGVLHSGDVVAKRTGETVESYFHKLRNIEAKLEDLITNLVDKEHWDTPQNIDIVAFLNKLPGIHVSDKFKFQILMDKVNDSTAGVDKNVSLNIKISEHDLSTVFDNIIANAVKWGFIEDNRNDYRIRIELSLDSVDDKEAVNICVSNNGIPIHKSVDRKRFFEWGYGSGSGIGTWQLKDIVEHYGGRIRLNEYPDDTSGFQTEYEIVLPLNNE